MKKWIALIVVVAAGSSGGYYAWRNRPPETNGDRTSTALPTAAAEVRNIHIAIKVAGDFGPAEQVSVRPEINGRIAELRVDVGDKVKKGDLLFRLDDAELQSQRASSATDVEVAKLQVERTQRNWERNQQLYEAKLVSKEVYENSKTDFELAKRSTERSQSALRLVDEQLSKTKIVAPFDCSVLTRPVSMGQAVSGSAGFNSGTEVLTIANLNDMIVNLHINQADISRVNLGQEVEIQVESVPDLKTKGVVDRLAPQATLRAGLKGYGVRVVVKNIDPRVRPGMTANVSIPVPSASNVVSIPLAAVFSDHEARYAYVKQGNTFEKRSIDIGVFDYDYAEVRSGLVAGEIVALEKPSKIAAPPAKGVRSGKPASPTGAKS